MTPTTLRVDADISSLMDDHLDAGDASGAITRLVASDKAQATWHRYHLIGDILRSDALAPCAAELGFAQRVMDSLDKQPSVTSEQADSKVVLQVDGTRKNSGTNAPYFRSKAAAGALVACLIVFLILGTFPAKKESATPQANTTQNQSDNQPQAVAGVEDRPVMNRDPELDALLSAHEQMGGHSALQTPSGFLRNATFARSNR